jgi:hypothetical protein
MSAAGALVLALSALVLLGVLAAWLLNLPLWLIGMFVVVAGLVIRGHLRRLSATRNRHDTDVRT